MSLLEQLNLSLNKIGSEGAQAGEGGTFSAESGSLHCVVQSTVLSCQDLQAKRLDAHPGVRHFARENNFAARLWRRLSRASLP